MTTCIDCGKRVGWPLQRCYDCTIDNEGREIIGAQQPSGAADGERLPADGRDESATAQPSAASDSTRHARLERLLREIVEAWDEYDDVPFGDVVTEWDRFSAAIEAARAAIGGKDG